MRSDSYRQVLLVAFVALSLVGNAAPARAADETSADNSPRHQEWVRIATPSGRTLRTFIVYPQASKAVPAVIIVHENRGMTPWERGLADDLAAAGFVTIVPDLLSEMGPERGASDSFESVGAAREAIHYLTGEQIMADLDAVTKYAEGMPAVDKRVAVAGFSWGGGQAFRYAVHNPQIAAAIVFYGPAPNDDLLQQLRVPVYGFYGENDFHISGDVPKLKIRAKALEKSFQAVTYPGAGHGFMRAGEAQDAKPADNKARDEAWVRLLSILGGLSMPAAVQP